MTDLRATVDNEWQKIENAMTNVDFNFFTQLKSMTSTILGSFMPSEYWGHPQNIDLNSC